MCAGKVTKKNQPYEVIRKELMFLIGQTRKPSRCRVRRPAPSHVANHSTDIQARISDSIASSFSTTLHSLWALAFPSPKGFLISKIKQDFGYQICMLGLPVLLSHSWVLGIMKQWGILPRLQHFGL